MTSEFVYNGATRKAKASSVTPKVLATFFKLEEDSLILTDEDGECYMVNGNVFNPPLPDGKKFEVDGTEKSVPGNTQLMIPQAQRDLAVIQGANRDRIITGVIENCQNMNESANMLYHGPQAVFLIESLALLSVCASDPSLITAKMPREKFVRLKTPESFRASLYQVAANMCAAFQIADYSMNVIRASLVDLPDYFETTLDVINQTDDQKTKKVMDKTIQKIENASTKCKEAANKAQEAFSEVIKDIDELCQAAIATNTISARELEKMKKLQQELKTKKEFQEKELERQEEMYKEAKKQAADALREYREQVANSGNMGKLFLATLTDGLFDTVKDMKDLMSTSVSAVAGSVTGIGQVITNHIPIVGTDKVHCSKAFNHAAENGILKTLETIHTNLEQIDDLEDNDIDDYIITLKEYQKYSYVTDEGKELFKKAKDVQKFLEKKRKNLKEISLKPEINQMRAEISIIIQTVTTVRQQRQEKEERKEQAANSLREQLVKADTEKTKSTQEHYNKQSDKEEQLRKELSTNKKELTDIICKLQNIDMTKVELTDVIKNLREGIEYLGRVKEHWQKLSYFFDNIKIIVENNLSENMQTFIENAKDDISRKLMLQAALKATGYCIQISNCAVVYTIISQKYVMPVVSGIGKQFALTPGEAIKKKSEIGTDLNKIMSEVEKLIDDKKEEYHKRTEDYMITHAEVLVNAISGNGKKALENKK